jgi:hypothetical protein
MIITDRLDQEPEEPRGMTPTIAPKNRQSLARVRRELSEDELSSPAVQRLLVEEIYRLEREQGRLEKYREDFHAADKRVAVLEVQANKKLAGEIVFGACLSVGAALLGVAPSLWDNQPYGWLMVVIGAFLSVLGIISRMVQR